MTMKIGYLVNQYPKTSHSFIRREIAGVEDAGLEVARYSVRRVSEPLVDPADVEEAKRTRVLLSRGVWTLLFELFHLCLRPASSWKGLCRASQLSRNSDRGLLYHLAYLAEAERLRRWAERDGVHHMHVHFGTNATTVADLCHALGGPGFSFTLHSPLSSEIPQLCALPEKLENSKFVCAVSEHGKSQLMRWSDSTAWERIHMVRCGTDAEFAPQGSSHLPEDRRLVCVARLSPEKGHAILLNALGMLKLRGIDARLDLVGDGPTRKALEEQVRRLGLENQVTFHGWKSGREVRELVLEARALVLPSFVEGLPVVIMEAFALQRPVIATWVGGVPELVVDAHTGWLVSPGSAESLANACEAALATAPQHLVDMGRRGAELVKEHHDSRRESKRLADLFRAHLTEEAA